jgi:cellulose synthase/poly-beta-1,6-N-acetylglucosamine synthase-like glycosyltransferase
VEPDISVLIPVRNEGHRVARTIQAIARARSTDARVEFVVVDDASTDGSMTNLVRAMPRLLDEPRIDVRVCQLPEHSGNYLAAMRLRRRRGPTSFSSLMPTLSFRKDGIDGCSSTFAQIEFWLVR